MEKDHKSPWLPRVLAPIVEKIVPPSFRKNVKEALEKRSESASEFVQEAAYLVANSYVVQSKGFQRILFAAQLFGLIYCFACILLPIPLFVMDAAVLGILTFYDFYTQNNQQSEILEHGKRSRILTRGNWLWAV